MDWQLPVAGLIVAGAAVYLGRQTWRNWRGTGKTCGGCSCSKNATPPQDGNRVILIPTEQLQLRRRSDS